jgi:hypothetical protein
VNAREHEHPVTWLLAANLDRARLDALVRAEGITRVL